MNARSTSVRTFFAASTAFSVLFTSLAAHGQSDLVPVRDITGGSSVFVFKGGQRGAPRKFVPKKRQTRTKAQRVEATRRVSKQYVDLARVKPRRERTAAISPDRMGEIRRMEPAQASKLFAGVGEYWIDQKDFKQASEMFGEAVQLDSGNTIARLGYSESLALLGNDELARDNVPSARSLFNQALTLNDKNAPAYFGLAEIAAGEENDADAAKNYEKALVNDNELTEIYVPLGILYYQQGEIGKAEDLLTRALAIEKNNAQLQYFIGLIRYAQNDNDAALAAFEHAKSLEPAYEEAYHFSGETLSRLKRYPEAIAQYNKAIALKENYFEAWFGLANAQFQLGDYKDAIVSYNRALRLNNRNVEGYINLGDANRLLGNYNDAEANYSIATSFAERDPAYDRTELADTYTKVGFVIAKQCEINRQRNIRCRLDGSLRALERAAELTPEGIDNGNLGWAYANAGRQDFFNNLPDAGRAKLIKAKVLLEKAANSNGPNAEGALMNLASVLATLGDNAGSLAVLKRAADKNPRSASIMNELGMAYMRTANYKEAASQFKKAVKSDDQFAAGYFNLGMAEFKSGNLGEAKKAYKKLKELSGADAVRYVSELEKQTNGAVKS